MFWPTLETRDELDSFSHQELIRRIRWLAANVGFIKGFIKNASTLVGSLRPQSLVEGEWADKAEKAFWRVAKNASVFDRSGKFNFLTAQKMLTRQSLRDGDVLTVLTESSNAAAMFAFYEAHQIRQTEKATEGDWLSGVLINPEGRHTYYSLANPKQKTSTVIPADRCIYFGEFDSAGNRRAIPPLAHAVNHSQDIVETWANVKAAIKAASLFGAIREREAASTQKSQAGMPGSILKTTSPNAPGEFNTAEVWSNAQIPQLPPGEKIKILHDNRPAPEQMAFVETLLTDIACGFGLPLEIIWKISELKSAGVRFVMEVASLWIQHRQEMLEAWARRVWIYTLAKEIKAGRLEAPPDGIAWWEVDFVPMRDITIDRGREGRMKMDEVQSGLATFSTYHREKGEDWRDSAKQRVTETAYHMELCEQMGVPYSLVFAPRAGQQSLMLDQTQPATE
jgi:capsid protein